MTSELLKSAFDNFYATPVSTWDELVPAGSLIDCKREDQLKASGEIEKYFYLVVEGSVGILIENHNRTICTDMLFENEFVCDYLSFITQKPTPYQVLALEHSKLFRISHRDFSDFTANNKLGDQIWRYATQALFVDKQVQQLRLLTLTATERYRSIMKHQPYIIKRIPQKYIAYYLGVTPQSLSRIRTEAME